MDQPRTPDLQFFLDPVCPFAWVTSRWVERLRELKGIEVEWRFISLSMVNEELDYATLPEGYAEGHRRGLRLLRVAAAVREAHGNEAVGRFYTACGESQWYAELPPGGDMFSFLAAAAGPSEILEAAGLPLELAAAAEDDRWDAVIRAETDDALGRAGQDLGTPILSFSPPDGPAFFGPVISSVPSDEDSVALWDALVALGRFPGFAELKRSQRDLLDLPLVRAAFGEG